MSPLHSRTCVLAHRHEALRFLQEAALVFSMALDDHYSIPTRDYKIDASLNGQNLMYNHPLLSVEHGTPANSAFRNFVDYSIPISNVTPTHPGTSAHECAHRLLVPFVDTESLKCSPLSLCGHLPPLFSRTCCHLCGRLIQTRSRSPCTRARTTLSSSRRLRLLFAHRKQNSA